MIARVNFDGVVLDGSKKLTSSDFVDIHVPNTKGLAIAKKMFLEWFKPGKVAGIKGSKSGIFHPLPPYGTITITSVTDRNKE